MLILAATLITQPSYAAQKFRSPDARRDWATARFGGSPLEDMKCTAGAMKDTKVCTRPAESEDTKIGDLKADTVTYHYFEKRLYRVDLGFKTDEGANAVAPVLRQVYGPGTWNVSERAEGWKGDQNAITWTVNIRSPGAVLSYTYLPILEDVEAARVKNGGASLEATAAAL